MTARLDGAGFWVLVVYWVIVEAVTVRCVEINCVSVETTVVWLVVETSLVTAVVCTVTKAVTVDVTVLWSLVSIDRGPALTGRAASPRVRSHSGSQVSRAVCSAMSGGKPGSNNSWYGYQQAVVSRLVHGESRDVPRRQLLLAHPAAARLAKADNNIVLGHLMMANVAYSPKT